MSSMSTESYLLDTSGSANSTPQSGSSQPQRQQRPNRFLSIPVAHPSDPPSPRPVSPGQLTIANTSANKVVDPLSSSIRTSPSSSSQSPTTCSSSLLRNNNTNISSSSSATASFSNKLTRNTGTKGNHSSVNHFTNFYQRTAVVVKTDFFPLVRLFLCISYNCTGNWQGSRAQEEIL